MQDRGTKKWTSLMLPEHIEGLKRVFKEEAYKEMPILDEQQKLNNELLLQMALKEDLAIQIVYFNNYDIHVTNSYILHLDILGGILRTEHLDISFAHIIEVNLI